MGLSEYTTEELRAEIKRRITEERKLRVKNMKPTFEYAYIEGEVSWVSGDPFTRRQYDVRLTYEQIKEFNLPLCYRTGTRVKIERNNFRKDTAPRVGDIVRLKSRKTKALPKGFGLFCEPIIIELVRRAGED